MPENDFELWFVVTNGPIGSDGAELHLIESEPGTTYLPLFSSQAKLDEYLKDNSIFALNQGCIRSLAAFDKFFGIAKCESGLPVQFVAIDVPPKFSAANPDSVFSIRARIVAKLDELDEQ